jgi:hypothetical protein
MIYPLKQYKKEGKEVVIAKIISVFLLAMLILGCQRKSNSDMAKQNSTSSQSGHSRKSAFHRLQEELTKYTPLRETDIDIIHGVLRKSEASCIFLEINNKDPSPYSLQNIAKLVPGIRKASEFRPGECPANKKMQKSILSLLGIRRLASDTVEVYMSNYAASLQADASILTLSCKSGSWLVIKKRTLWIS